jgi:DnaD/phage-associated family protein
MPISKKIRFEVFKRDEFRCRYCGSTPPECVLEIDHIIPKSKGGKDELINLLTSCFDCNRGKGCRKIDSKVSRPDIKEINSELKEQVEATELYYSLQKDILSVKESQLNLCLDYWYENGSSYISPKQVSSLRNFLNEFPADTIVEAMSIACNKVNGWNNKFRYMCGILHNWKRDSDGTYKVS